MTLLEVHGLEVTYPGGAAAVRGVDLRLAAGQKLGVAGESGCDASTPTLALRPRAVVSVLNPRPEVDR